MANEYLIQKWRIWFKTVDRRHSGQLTQEDEKRTEDTFVELAHLDGKEKEKALETSRSQWDQLVFHGKSGPVTEADFVASTNSSYKADKNLFKETMRKSCVESVKIMDKEGKGYLTEEEFTKAYKAFGFNNEEWLKSFFNVFKPEDGKARTDRLVECWVEFLTDEDDSKADVLYETLKRCPDLEKFAALNHLDPEQKKMMIQTMNKLLSENIFYGKTGPITEDEFVEMQDNDFKSDKEKYIVKRKNYFTTVFKMIDICREGITEDEFVNGFIALGHKSVSLDKKFFHDFKLVDGKILMTFS